MTGWILINGQRQSRALFSCGVCNEMWSGLERDWPNFCPFCRGTHIHRRDHLPAWSEGMRVR
jgi:hypothetical protein